MPLLSEPAFRRRLMGEIEDHQLAGTWAWFDAQSPAARAEMVAPLANKLAAFTLRRNVRAVVGQAETRSTSAGRCKREESSSSSSPRG